MIRFSKGFAVILIVTLAVSVSSFMVMDASCMDPPPKPSNMPIPSVPKFSLSYVDHSYEVPETTISHTDPYTGKVTTETQPGYHVKNYTIDVIIENQNLPATIEGNQLVMKYTVQIKATMKMTFRFKQTHLKLT